MTNETETKYTPYPRPLIVMVIKLIAVVTLPVTLVFGAAVGSLGVGGKLLGLAVVIGGISSAILFFGFAELIGQVADMKEQFRLTRRAVEASTRD